MSINKDSNVEGGLFTYYDAALEACRPALKTCAGTPVKQLQAPAGPRDCEHRQVIAAAAVAAGTVRLLGDAVEAYNRKVDDLNAHWRTAKSTTFGVAPVACSDGADDAEIRQATLVHADRLLDAKLELLSDLEREHSTARRVLDDAIAAATERLAAGPTAEVLADLLAAGGVPATVVRAVATAECAVKAS